MFDFAVFLVAACCYSSVCVAVSTTNNNKNNAPKVYILFGHSGVGKSTLGNCLLNRNGSLEAITDSPFATSDDTESLTHTLQLARADHAVVIDTPCLDQVFANVSGFRAELCALLDAERLQLDALVFVMSSKGQLMDANARQLEKLLQEVFKGRATRRLALVVTKCEPGWLQKPRQRASKPLLRIVAAVDEQRAHEFDLKFDHEMDEPDEIERNIGIRQRAIDSLVHFVANLTFESGNGNEAASKIDLNGINNGMLHNAFNFLKRPFDYMIQGLMNNMTRELADAKSYQGGVYAPEFKRIFLVPYERANNTVAWHFVDCESGRVRMYNSPRGENRAVFQAYRGGVYSPTQQRVYFVPWNQASEPTWHYIDTSTELVKVVTYNHNLSVALVRGAYAGGVYVPAPLDRIYLVPYNQATQRYWHYIDCRSGQVVAYEHGMNINESSSSSSIVVKGAYVGGVYSPTQPRVYFVPHRQSFESTWHYVECGEGRVVAYKHGASTTMGAYVGGQFAPDQERIYFVPYNQAFQPQWHFLDCRTGRVVAYKHKSSAVYEAYRGAVYCPQRKRIYLVPYKQAQEDNWHYIDCSRLAAQSDKAEDETRVVAYRTRLLYDVDVKFVDGVYVPDEPCIVLLPHKADSTRMLNIDCNNAVVYRSELYYYDRSAGNF